MNRQEVICHIVSTIDGKNLWTFLCRKRIGEKFVKDRAEEIQKWKEASESLDA